MPFDDSEVIEGYENFQKLVESLRDDGSPLIFLFEANEIGGVSWCPDCEKLKKVWLEVKRTQHLPEKGRLVHVRIGTSGEWVGNTNSPFKKDPKLRLLTVPTLMRWNTDKRLRGNDVFSTSKLMHLMK